MKPLQEAIVKHGSLAGAINAMGPSAEHGLAQAFEELRLMAPESMRQIPEFVVIWASLQVAWEVAERMGDSKEMRAVAKQREDMLKRLH